MGEDMHDATACAAGSNANPALSTITTTHHHNRVSSLDLESINSKGRSSSTLSSPSTKTSLLEPISFTPPLSTRIARKPSPGLAARLEALGLASHQSRKSANSVLANDSIGRIEQEKIDQLDQLTRANLAQATVQRRGRAWTEKRQPRITGDSSTGFIVTDDSTDPVEDPVDDPITTLDRVLTVEEGQRVEVDSESEASVIALENSEMILCDDYNDMDSQKYRLPDHINGNGTKAMPEIRQAHIERASPPQDDDVPPPPPPKDSVLLSPALSSGPSVPSSATTPQEFHSPFNPLGLERAGSIYTLSRVSFANQLAQLTSLQLPDAASLATRVAAIPTSQLATHALTSAAEQIKRWILKASDVLDGLDADDDVEWAAAGGREGLAEVDNAIMRFDELVNVYVSAIERLQDREDIISVPAKQLVTVVTQVEDILSEWEQIRKTLNRGKRQVEIAMEWEEIWNVVLGDIGSEMDTLSRLVFEMEERRHRSMVEEAADMDIKDLETIVEDTPPGKTRANAVKNNRFSINSGYPLSPDSPQHPGMSQEDSSLLSLFARMQPLRASLDFLPMRLASFHMRAEGIFPTACEELESRRGGLDSSWTGLEKDAESLRRELGEDRWIMVFRGAGKQAQKMYESVDRSMSKVKEAINAGEHLHNPGSMVKKIEGYETKKTHYGPAIDRVLVIIARGVQDRLTVNGEIVRLQNDMQRRWQQMKSQMVSIDAQLESIQADKRNQQLRDSISSLVSNDRSTLASFRNSPGSSPASSVVMSSIETPTPKSDGRARVGFSNLPQPSPHRNARSKSPANGLSILGQRKGGALSSLGFSSLMSSSRERNGPAVAFTNRFSKSTTSEKPRWSSVVRPKADPLGFTFNELQLHSPSPHAKQPLVTPRSTRQMTMSSSPSTTALRAVSTPLPRRESRIPMLSPKASPNAESASNPRHDTTPVRPRASSKSGFHTRLTTPGPYNQSLLRAPTPSGIRTLRSQASTGDLSNRRPSIQPGLSALPKVDLTPRPASSMALNDTGRKRMSMLPTPTSYVKSSPVSIMSRGRPGLTTSNGNGIVNGNNQLAMTPSGRKTPASAFRDLSTGSTASRPDSILDRPRPNWR